MRILDDPATQDKDTALARLGELMSRADSYDPLPHDREIFECSYDVYQGVWGEASELRRSGKLLEFGKRIRCPVVAIHGDFDPHPAEGAREPLSRILSDFRFILLPECGHAPWIERRARDRFYGILREELASG
jgi:pimeloyl-ACP methyl ester carboxylesterase